MACRFKLFDIFPLFIAHLSELCNFIVDFAHSGTPGDSNPIQSLKKVVVKPQLTLYTEHIYRSQDQALMHECETLIPFCTEFLSSTEGRTGHEG